MQKYFGHKKQKKYPARLRGFFSTWTDLLFYNWLIYELRQLLHFSLNVPHLKKNFSYSHEIYLLVGLSHILERIELNLFMWEFETIINRINRSCILFYWNNYNHTKRILFGTGNFLTIEIIKNCFWYSQNDLCVKIFLVNFLIIYKITIFLQFSSITGLDTNY